MLKIFRTDIFSQAAIIVIASLCMWVGVFLHPEPIPIIGGGPVFYWLTSHLSARLGAIIAYLLVLAQGFLLNSMLYRHKMINQNTLMPMLFYVLAMSIGSPTLSPLLLGNTLLILAIGQMMLTTTLLSLTIDKTFAAAALMSIATVFCPAMWVFFVPLVLNMINYSLYNWRDWTMLILGILAPYFLIETIYFVTDQLFYRNYLLWYDMTNLKFSITGHWSQWIESVVIIVILLMGLGSLMVNSQGNTVNYKKNITAMMIFIIGSLIYSFYTTFIPLVPQSYAVTFACCATALFATTRRKETMANICFLLIIVGVIICNYL